MVIAELITAVRRSLEGCPGTATPEPPSPTPTVLSTAPPTATVAPSATPASTATPSTPPTRTAASDRCPLTFGEIDESGCRFEGLYNASQDGCRDAEVAIVVRRRPDTSGVAFELDTRPTVILSGRSLEDPTAYQLRFWTVAGEAVRSLPISTARLFEDGRRLRIGVYDPAPFSIDGCDFREFVGVYAP